MLVSARIKPVEQWCGPARMYDTHGRFYLLAGMVVQVVSERMVAGETLNRPCDGRAWLLTDESRERVARRLNRETVSHYACEHQLELGD